MPVTNGCVRAIAIILGLSSCKPQVAVPSFTAPIYHLQGTYKIDRAIFPKTEQLCTKKFTQEEAMEHGYSWDEDFCWDSAESCLLFIGFQPSNTAVPAAEILPSGGLYHEAVVPAENILVYDIVQATGVGCADGQPVSIRLTAQRTSLALLTFAWSSPDFFSPDIDRFLDESSWEWRFRNDHENTEVAIIPYDGQSSPFFVELSPGVPMYNHISTR